MFHVGRQCLVADNPRGIALLQQVQSSHLIMIIIRIKEGHPMYKALVIKEDFK